MEPSLIVGIGVLALVSGTGLGYLIGNRGTKKTRVVELENSLESAQEELADYKREVVGQFAETADKFRALDKSYHDLHRHLAESSVALCGDAGMSLLDKPDASLLEETVLEQADEDIVLAENPSEEPIVALEASSGEIEPETLTDVVSASADAEEISDLKKPEQKVS